MKIKQRALAILLSMVMVLTFMPALAFANGDVGQYWSLQTVGNADVVLAPGTTTTDLAVEVAVNEEDYTAEQLAGLSFTYSWIKTVYDEDLEENVDTEVGTEKTLTGATVADYKCIVTDSYGNSDWVYFGVSDAEPNAMVFVPTDEVREVWNRDIFREGDKITLSYSGYDDTTYTYSSGKWLNNGNEFPFYIYATIEKDGSEFDPSDEDNIGKNFTYTVTVRLGNETDPSAGPFGGTCVSGVASLSFSPNPISIWGPDIAETYEWGTYYALYKRGSYTGTNGAETNSDFALGDNLTVNFIDGTSKTYNFGYEEFEADGEQVVNGVFKNGDEQIWPDIEYDYENGLQPGNNAASVTFRQASTSVTIFIDTQEQKDARDQASAQAAAQAAAAAEALEWNGNLNTSIPAAKSVKAKAAKKKVTVKWKKANKKNLKKFDSVEIQVCTDTNFAKANTKRFVVKKSKKSKTIKGLTSKTTYYVRVRDVKGSGTSKQVSNWSKPKKVKVK